MVSQYQTLVDFIDFINHRRVLECVCYVHVTCILRAYHVYLTRIPRAHTTRVLRACSPIAHLFDDQVVPGGLDLGSHVEARLKAHASGAPTEAPTEAIRTV